MVYDGPDLDDVADLWGVSREEVVARHTGLERPQNGRFKRGFVFLQIERRLLIRDSAGEGPDEITHRESCHDDPQNSAERHDGRSAESEELKSIDRH